MNKRIIIVGIIIIVIVAAAAWIMTQNHYSAPASYEPQQGAPEASAPQPSLSGETQTPTANHPTVPIDTVVKEFTVTGQNYSFTPSTLRVQKGDKVKIVFKNSGGFHDFRIDEFGAATRRINNGEQDTIIFTADKVGPFEFYCSVGNHRQMGMKGTLMVQP